MITVSEEFKTAMKASTRELKAYLDDGNVEITSVDDLKSLRIIWNSGLCKTVLRQAEAEYFGEHNYLNNYVHIGVGVVLPDTSTEYLDYGSFKVISAESNKGIDGIKIKMFDKMYESLQPYDLEPIYDIVFPLTLKELLETICTRLGWTLATATFPNDSLEIASDIFSTLGLSFRNILDMIAEASGSILFFNNDDELVVRQISDTIEETLDKDTLNSFKVEAAYGPINRVVLSRQPQEDNIAQDHPI